MDLLETQSMCPLYLTTNIKLSHCLCQRGTVLPMEVEGPGIAGEGLLQLGVYVTQQNHQQRYQQKQARVTMKVL